MAIHRLAVHSLLMFLIFAGLASPLLVRQSLAQDDVWKRVHGQEIHPGMRVMIVKPSAVTLDKEGATCRVDVGSIAKVYEVLDGGKDKELIVLDDFGLGKVKASDVIVLRQSDVFEQINDRIPAQHQKIALAEFAALYDLDKADEMFRLELGQDPDNKDIKTRYALFLWKHNRSDELNELDLDEHTQSDNTRLVITATLLPVDQEIDRLQEIVKRNQKDLFSRSALVDALEGQLLSPNETSRVAFAQLETCSDEINGLVPDHPNVFSQIIVCSVDRAVKGGDVDVAKFQERLKAARHSQRRFPYDHNLASALVTGNLAGANYAEASRLAMDVVTRFPTSHKSMELLRSCSTGLDSVGVEDRGMNRFMEEYKIGYLIAGLEGVDPADLYPGKLPHVSLIDGNAPLNFRGTQKDEQSGQRQGIAKLCSEDQEECLRFLNDYAPDSISSAPDQEVFEAAVQSGSYHAIEFLLSSGKQLVDPQHLLQLAIEHERHAVLLQLISHHGSLPQTIADMYTQRFNVQSSDIRGDVTKKSLVRFQSELKSVFAQAIALQKLSADERRSIESTYAELERIVAKQEVYGDFQGAQQTRAGLRQLDQQFQMTEKISDMAKVQAIKNLNSEYQSIKNILDPAGLDGWLAATDEYIAQNVRWFGPAFEEWKVKVQQ